MVFDPKEAVMEFLRARLTDPAGRHSTNSNTFSGDGSTKTFTITPTGGTKLRAITSITVDAASQKKWEDFTIDLQNQQITFFTAPPTGVNNVVVNFKEGTTSWIYKDKPRKDLTDQSFPRMNVFIVNASDFRAGKFDTALHSVLHFQLDCWAKQAQVFTIDGRKYEGPELAYYLLNQARLAFKGFEDDLYPNLHDYQSLSGPRDLPFDETYQNFHGILEFNMQGTNVGE